MKKVMWTILGMAIVLGGLMMAARTHLPKPPAPTAQDLWKTQGVPVETAAIAPGSLTETVEVTGDLCVLNNATISPKAAGRLLTVKVREGDLVTKGEVVALQDQQDALNNIQTAQAALASSKARLSQAQTTSEVTAEQKQSAIDQARANLQSVQAALRSAQTRWSQAVTTADVTKKQLQSDIESAQAGVDAAEARLTMAKKPSRTQEVLVAQNAVDSARANLDNAEANYQRYKGLFERGAVSAVDYGTMKTQYSVAQASYNSAKAQLSLLQEGGRAEDIATAQSSLEVARTQLHQARSNAVAKTRLGDEDVATAHSAVQQAQAAVVVAHEQVKQAQTNIAENRLRKDDITAAQAAARQAETNLIIAQRQLADTQIIAPIAGVIATRTADPGQVVSPGQAVATIVDLTSVYLKGAVAEQALRQIAPGQSVQVTVDALPGLALRGVVREINPAGSTTNRNFFVRIAIPRMDRQFKPGMFARGIIYTGRAAAALLVPKDAIEEQQGTKLVFTIGADGIARRQVITVVREDATFAQLGAATGLHPGDRVVTTGHQNLQDGIKVDVRPR